MESNGLFKSIKRESLMETVAAAIVKSRFIIFVLFALAAIYCALSIGKVNVYSSLTALLPPEAETRQGLTIMEEEFEEYSTAQVMVSNVTYEKAAELSEEIGKTEHVTDVTFDDTQAHYKNASALFSVTFDADSDDDGVKAASDKIRELVEPYDHYINQEINGVEKLIGEMGVILLLAIIVIVAVLLFTSHSYFEVVIFAIVFIFAGLLNMGRTSGWVRYHPSLRRSRSSSSSPSR